LNILTHDWVGRGNVEKIFQILPTMAWLETSFQMQIENQGNQRGQTLLPKAAATQSPNSFSDAPGRRPCGRFGFPSASAASGRIQNLPAAFSGTGAARRSRHWCATRGS
jgi:hypothetical protein